MLNKDICVGVLDTILACFFLWAFHTGSVFPPAVLFHSKKDKERFIDISINSYSVFELLLFIDHLYQIFHSISKH
jgi:hypothetical protein